MDASVASPRPARGFLSNSEIEEIGKRFNLGDVLRVTFIPSGLMNSNWRFETARGSVAVKRLTDSSAGDVSNNLAVMRVLADRHLPVCTPLTADAGDSIAAVQGSSYCAMPWVYGRQPHGLHLTIEESKSLGLVLAKLHVGLENIGTPLLPEAEQRPTGKVADSSAAAAEADRFVAMATRASPRSAFDNDVVKFLRDRKVLLQKNAHRRPAAGQLPGPYGWTHGDFQHLNVIWSGDRVSAVIDWDRIRVRMLGEEVARSATLLFGHEDGWLDLDRVAAFVAGYRSVVTISGEDLADAADRLWWKRICDFWHLEFHYDRNDYTCDHLFASSCRFLGWWTQHLGEVRTAMAGNC